MIASLLAAFALAAGAALLAMGLHRPGRAPGWNAILAGALLLIVSSVYLALGSRLGSPAPPPAPSTGVEAPNSTQGSKQGGDLRVLVGRLAEKQAKDPGNGEGWALLAHTYSELQQHKEASEAYAKAAGLLPADARLLSDWADARVLANDRHWDAKARDIVARALKLDPLQLKALALAGSEAYARQDYPQAIAYWKRMKAAAPPNSADAKLADANIAEATAIMSGKKPPG